MPTSSKPPVVTNRIAELRAARGYSAPQLARRIGVSRQQMNGWENGSRNLSMVWMERIAAVLGCTVQDLVATRTSASADDEVVPLPLDMLEPHIRALVDRGFRFYKIVADSVSALGLEPGKTITVEETPTAATALKNLDVVLVSVTKWTEATPVRLLRQFVAPSLLVTNRTGHNEAIDFRGNEGRYQIVGIVQR